MSDTVTAKVQSELDTARGWLSAPLTTKMPLWQILVVFGLFVVVAFIVLDMLNLLKEGLSQ